MNEPYRLRLYPDAVLRQRARAVTDINAEVHGLLQAMASIMYAHGGIGLAGPQAGALLRVIVADIGEGLVALANPAIFHQEGEGYLVEGCLSLPDVRVNVRRSRSIAVQGLDMEGREVVLESGGLMARVLQHEIDHLNGVLIVDHGPAIDEGAMAARSRASDGGPARSL